MKHCTLLFFFLSFLPAAHAAPHVVKGGTPAESENEELAAALKEAKSTLRVLNRLSEAIPHEPLEAEQLLAQVSEQDGDVAFNLTRWIAEKVSWLPYRGALRGSRGVLIERRANSLDESLLLAEALAGSGREVRLARALLSPEIAGEMLTKIHAPAAVDAGAADAEESGSSQANELARYAELAGVDPARLQKKKAEQDVKAQAFLERVLPLAIGQAEALKRKLSEGGVEKPVESLRSHELESLRDHWWVQSSADGESWIDHDPLAVRAQVELSIEPESTFGLGELPASERHTLSVRVVAERMSPEGLETSVALNHVVDATTLSGGHYVLGFRPLNPDKVDPAAAGEDDSGAFLLRVARAETEWLPTLISYDYRGTTELHQESSIYVDGTLNEKPQLDGKSRKLGDAITGLSGMDVEKVASDSAWTAVWLEYELSAPGEASETIRRALFDLIGEVRRREIQRQTHGPIVVELKDRQVAQRGLALSGQSQILPVTCRLSADFYTRLMLFTKRKNQRLVVDLAQGIVDGKGNQFIDRASEFSTPPLELLMLAKTRLDLGRHTDRVFLRQLNVFASHVQPFEPAVRPDIKFGAKEKPPVLLFGKAIDVVANHVGVVSQQGDEKPMVSAWDIRLEQGVLDTVLEVTSLTGVGEQNDPQTQALRTLADNTAMWMERFPIDQWSTFKPGEELSGPPCDSLVRASEALAAGKLAVLPSAFLDTEESDWRPECWWRVDSATGETLGIGPRGWGQTMAEKAAMEIKSVALIHPMRAYGARLFCFFTAAAFRVGVSLAAAGIGQAAGAEGWMPYVMAALAQAGVQGAAATLVRNACVILVLV